MGDSVAVEQSKGEYKCIGLPPLFHSTSNSRPQPTTTSLDKEMTITMSTEDTPIFDPEKTAYTHEFSSDLVESWTPLLSALIHIYGSWGWRCDSRVVKVTIVTNTEEPRDLVAELQQMGALMRNE